MNIRFSFVWNDDKAQANEQKHRVTFKEASSVFNTGSDLLTIYDEEHSENEERWVTIGFSVSGLLLVIAHTYKVEYGITEIRIISARKATKTETKLYKEQV